MQKGLQSSFEIWCWDRDEIEESGHVGVKLKDTIYGFYPRKGEVVGGVFHPVDALGVVLVESETDCAAKRYQFHLFTFLRLEWRKKLQKHWKPI